MVRDSLSDKQLRAYVCRCCRRIWHRLADARSRAAVEAAERYAAGEAGDGELEAARQDAQRAYIERSQEGDDHAAAAAFYCASPNAHLLPAAANRVLAAVEVKDAERAAQADLLRSVVGNPFRTTS
jgi:hypothetical protein